MDEARRQGVASAVTSGWPREELDEVVEQIYLATTEPERWSAIIERIGRRIDANIAAVHVIVVSTAKTAARAKG